MAKHRTFADYTRRYNEILCQKPQKPELRLTIVDGFCGGGAYRFEDGVVAGSPLILLRGVREAGGADRLIAEAYTAERPVRFHLD
ncbi:MULTISPECIES: three-Cys-motif partner protein TcmP [unclassified Methylobacterium]|uniref:three-Cys-motif partner protein TcmP n=1 Tax=unclassified Methylobacterium TaxID=2615210 RepID=UPI000A7EBA48|nr:MULTISPECIES: three-Cys-motif partner protein TcmP [unclassified Methylobacterium]